MSLAIDLIEALEDAAKTTESDYQNLVPLAMTLQKAQIETIADLQTCIRMAKEPKTPATAWQQIITFILEKL